ncbi:MAG: hypothetical protein JOZ07_08605 [Solirubrobacterales bacterium]|nr:hypothetical protein [Solirubrobacterales bacterium]
MLLALLARVLIDGLTTLTAVIGAIIVTLLLVSVGLYRYGLRVEPALSPSRHSPHERQPAP